MGLFNSLAKAVKSVPVVGGLAAKAGTMVKDTVYDITGTNQARALRHGNNAEEGLIDDYEYQAGDALNYSLNPTAQFQGTQANGIPRGQQEAMKYQQDVAKNAVASSMAGGLKGRSGAAIKALSDRMQGIAAQNYQQAFDNNLSQAQENRQVNNQNFNQQYMKSGQQLDNTVNMLNARTQNNANRTQANASKSSVGTNLIKALNPFG